MENTMKTTLLLGLLTGLIIWFGGAMGGQTGLVIAFIFALMMNFGAYWFSDKIVLKMYKAKEVSKDHKLYLIVRDLAHKAKIPIPKVYLISAPFPNAFATGRNPKNASVAATQSLLQVLSDEEIKGVMAHELSHVKHRDTLIQTIAATIAGVISYLAFMARFAAFFGGGNDRDSGNMFEMLALAIITPLLAMIIQLAISRSREYLADETGARTIQNPKALASALRKLELSAKQNPLRFGNKATSSLFIVNPFSAKGLTNILSTHPSMEKRIERLNNLKLS